MTLKVGPLSSTVVPELNTSQVKQSINVGNPSKDKLRLRFKVSYTVNGAEVEESGVYEG